MTPSGQNLIVGAGTVLLVLSLSPLSAAAPSQPSQQQQASLPLDELVVTGTRTPRKVSDTPVRTEVVSGEEIRKTHAKTVKEALENVPGLLLRRVHGKSGYEIWLQGLNADRVLVLIDGLPMTATTGSSMDVSQLNTLAIERIEIVKGAVSAQYGSAGMGGVVNIITRPIPEGVVGSLTLDGGTYRDQNPSGDPNDVAKRNARAAVSLGGSHWRWRLSAARQETDGIDPEPDNWARPGDAVERSHLTNRLEWHPGDGHQVTAQLRYFREEAGSRYVLARPGNPVNAGKDELAERWRGTLLGDHQPESGPQWHWRLVHETLDDTTSKFTPLGRFDHRESTHTVSRASGWTQFQPFDRHQVQIGTDLSRASLEQYKDGVSELSGDGTFTRNTREGWLQATWFATEHSELVAGVRAQRDSDFGNHVAPKLNGRYELVDGPDIGVYLRGGWGVGYRVPNLKERHYRFDHSELGYVVRGNPDLQPEESDSYQLGWGLNYRKEAWFEVNAFLNNIDQLIQTESDPSATENGVQVFEYANVDRARTRGVETTMGWQFSGDWKLSAGYTYLETEDLDSGQRLTRRPRHHGTLSLTGGTPVPGLSWLARMRAQSSELVDQESGAESPGFTTADIKLNQSIGDHLTLFTGVDNLTDEQRNFNDNNDFGPVSGRFFYAGLTLSFGPTP
ncbi:outer membrane receptor for ferrienterochelin and colicins [Tamilnaduibacter salinus]|uniref:Outer membrane receptor for ferrienterochelin and colicins n=1 Tax=Tamilnaduibacter salinus TaxID=1484056 RepID=A0A2U1CZC7_9GAMM|nr:TonB-dependent receptor [Tamilnaduibacter salinus]PVY78123.1 outer membrane receptor for ferrienterochelin and colicins [Tamilnaduibacter salinus]